MRNKRHNGKTISLEDYKQSQRDSIISQAVNHALSVNKGVAPIKGYDDSGNPIYGSSCLWTNLWHFGRQGTALNNELMRNPEKYGWKVQGPIDSANIGDLWIYQDDHKNPGKWSHSTLITGKDDNNNFTLSYSRGNAGAPVYTSDEELKTRLESQNKWNRATGHPEITFEQLKEQDRKMAVEKWNTDYGSGRHLYDVPVYKTLRFIGTPADNVKWEQEYNSFPNAIEDVPKLKPITNKVITSKTITRLKRK